MNQNLKDLEYSHPVRTAENENDYSEENIKGVPKQWFDKEVNMGVNLRPSQPPQHKMQEGCQTS